MMFQKTNRIEIKDIEVLSSEEQEKLRKMRLASTGTTYLKNLKN